MRLHRDRPCPLSHLARRDLRGGDDEDLGARDQLSDGDGDVAGAGRQVEQEHVEVAPEHVGEELLQRPMQHRTAPDHRCVAGREHPDGDDPHAVRLRWHDHPLDLGGSSGDAEHPGHAVPVDVGIDHPYRQAPGGERHGNVDRDGRLADAALPGRDGVHPGE